MFVYSVLLSVDIKIFIQYLNKLKKLHMLCEHIFLSIQAGSCSLIDPKQ